MLISFVFQVVFDACLSTSSEVDVFSDASVALYTLICCNRVPYLKTQIGQTRPIFWDVLKWFTGSSPPFASVFGGKQIMMAARVVFNQLALKSRSLAGCSFRRLSGFPSS